MNFKDKYIKYKFKYLQLKYQYGGFPTYLEKKYMPPQLKGDEKRFCVFYNKNIFKPLYEIKCDSTYGTRRNKTHVCHTDVAKLQKFIIYLNVLCDIWYKKNTICNENRKLNQDELNKRKQQRDTLKEICSTYRSAFVSTFNKNIADINNLQLNISIPTACIFDLGSLETHKFSQA